MSLTISKVCTGCNIKKPSTEFNKRAKAKDGLRYSCKACDAKVHRDWDANEKQRQIAPKVTLPPASEAQVPEALVSGELAPLAVSSQGAEAGGKVIGHIGQVVPRIREYAVDPIEEAERIAVQEYANLLNRKLNIRQRANLLVKIAKNAQGPSAALALQALRDINTATGITNNKGAQIELGPLIVIPGASSMKMGSGGGS